MNRYDSVYGGGIYNGGTLTIHDSTISGNFVTSSSPTLGAGIYNGGTLTISRSTLSENVAYSMKSGDGGGIYNAGTLKINKSTLSGNSSTGPTWYASMGGGISNDGALTIKNITLSGNSIYSMADYGRGGGIYNSGTLTVSNSTLSENAASSGRSFGQGGGIYNGGTLTISNGTLNGNGATGYYGGSGGSIYNLSEVTATLQNSIVANSPSGGNCAGSMTSSGYNLSSDNTCNFTGPGDMNNADPKLGKVLKDNGGPTQTIRLLPGSPAIDAGNPNGCTDDKGNLLTTDQRGWLRPDKQSGRCDIGALEKQKN